MTLLDMIRGKKSGMNLLMSAPSVTEEDIEANIAHEFYFNPSKAICSHFPHPMAPDDGVDSLKLMTICILVLRNGFTVMGSSACVSPDNYDEAVGMQIARKNAIEKVWPLMGYALMNRIALRDV